MNSSFWAPSSGWVAFTSISPPVRGLVIDALIKGGVEWRTVGRDCRRCLFSDLDRESVLAALRAALAVAKSDGFVPVRRHRWRVDPRLVLVEALENMIFGLEGVTDPVVVLVDDAVACPVSHEVP